MMLPKKSVLNEHSPFWIIVLMNHALKGVRRTANACNPLAYFVHAYKHYKDICCIQKTKQKRFVEWMFQRCVSYKVLNFIK